MKYTTSNEIRTSPTESMIRKGLVLRNIKFAREVMFDGLINPKTGYKLRYDFYLPNKNILIEYDGKDYHKDNETKERDLIKNRFAKDNGFKLIRLSGIKSISTFFEMYFKLKESNESIINKPKKNKSKKKRIKVKKISILDRQKERLQNSNTKPMQWVFKDDKANHVY